MIPLFGPMVGVLRYGLIASSKVSDDKAFIHLGRHEKLGDCRVMADYQADFVNMRVTAHPRLLVWFQ